MLETLYKEALDRKKNPKEGSYTNYLFDKGLDKILKKVGEEATEVVIGAKNADKEENTDEARKKFNVFLICMIPVPLIGFIFLLIGLRSFL